MELAGGGSVINRDLPCLVSRYIDDHLNVNLRSTGSGAVSLEVDKANTGLQLIVSSKKFYRISSSPNETLPNYSYDAPEEARNNFLM